MKESDDGFTLIEVIVSLTLFVLVAGAATFAIISSIRASDVTNQRVAAGQVAQQELDRVRALGPNPVVSARPLPTGSATSADGVTFTVTVIASPTWSTPCYIGTAPVTGGFRNLEVTVALPGGRISPVVMDTRMACSAAPTP